MELSLDYGSLEKLISRSRSLAGELEEYCDDITRKVQSKLYSVTGGSSGNINSSDYYIEAKLKKLREKRDNAYNISDKTQILLDTARRVDREVESSIKASQKKLFTQHPDLKPPKYKAAVVKFFCDCKNIPVIGWLIKGGEAVSDCMTAIKNDIRHWYKCDGGKELVGIVLSTVAAVLAVVVCVCAFVFTGGTVLAVIAGVAGAISAVIGVVNAVTNVVTSFQAYNSAVGGHPGMAKIEADRNTLSDVLREHNFHNKLQNKLSYAGATTIEVTDAVCSIVSIVCGGIKLVKDLKAIDIKKTFDFVGKPRSTLGTVLPEKSNFWTGLQTFSKRFNIKDLLLGDLNVKDLSRIGLLDTKSAFKAIGTFSKALLGITNDLDAINESDMNFAELIAKRAIIGVNKNIFNQEELKTGEVTRSDGEKVAVRKYETTNLSTILDALPTAIDSIGLGKLMNGWLGNDTLDNIFDFSSGIVGKIEALHKAVTLDYTGHIKSMEGFTAKVLAAITAPAIATSFPFGGFIAGSIKAFVDFRFSDPFQYV